MGSCDNRCTSGKEGNCRCSCGGANHGTAKQIWDIIQDGGNANVKGKGLDLHLAQADNGRVQVWQRGNKVQQYKSEEEFVKDLGKLIRAGQVDVDATDAYNKRQVNLPADPERSNREKKLTDKEAQKQIRETGATVSRKDGEYKVNVPGGTEATAYYTDDPSDAVGTARAMMKQHGPTKTYEVRVSHPQAPTFSKTFTNKTKAEKYADGYLTHKDSRYNAVVIEPPMTDEEFDRLQGA